MSATAIDDGKLLGVGLCAALALHGAGAAALVYVNSSAVAILPASRMGFEIMDLTSFAASPETPAPQTAAESIPPPEAEPAPLPEPVPEPLPEPQPEPTPAPEPIPAPEPEPEPIPAPTPDAELAFTREAPPEHVQPRTETAPPATAEAAPAEASAAALTRTAPPPGPPSAETSPPRSDAAYLNNAKPAYPLSARRRRLEGLVLLEVTVDKHGHPATVAIKTSSGHTVLDDAARWAVEKWRFVPARQNGTTVVATVEVPIRFALN